MVSGCESEQNDEKVDGGRWRLSGEETPALRHSAAFSCEGFTLALSSPRLPPCHFCLVDLKQKEEKNR